MKNNNKHIILLNINTIIEYQYCLNDINIISMISILLLNNIIELLA